MKTSLSKKAFNLSQALQIDGFRILLQTSSCIILKKNNLTIKIR